MKRALPFALLALVFPAAAVATPLLYTTGDFVGDTSSGSIATSIDVIVAGILATMTMDARALHLTPNTHGLLGPAPEALFLLIPTPATNNFADNMPLGIAKVNVDFPEPGSLGLLGLGLIGLAAIVRWTTRGTNPLVQKGMEPLGDVERDATRASPGWESTARAASEVSEVKAA